MPFFAKAMKDLADDLRASTDVRAADVTRVRAAAERVLTDARAFMTQTTKEHQERARRLRQSLREAHSRRLQQVHRLCRDIQKEHRDMADALQRMLSSSRKSREENVTDLLTGFRAARADLASDLRQGSEFWQDLHAHRKKAGR